MNHPNPAEAIESIAKLLALAGNSPEAIRESGKLTNFILGGDPPPEDKNAIPESVEVELRGKSVPPANNCKQGNTLKSVSKCPTLSKSVPQMSLFELESVPEQRLQVGREYSQSIAAIRKRRQRAKSQSRTKSVPLANITYTNSLATPSDTIKKHLTKLGIAPAQLYLVKNSVSDPTIKELLEKVGIPYAYYNVLADRYFPHGIEKILYEVNKRRQQPAQAKFFTTKAHTICTFLRWVINGLEGDKFGNKSVTLNTLKIRKDELYQASFQQYLPVTATQELKKDSELNPEELAEVKRELAEALAKMPWLKTS